MAKTYEPIATQTLGSANATVTFSSIPSTYTDLIVISVISGTATTGTTRLNFNGDVSTNYSYTIVQGNGSSATSGRAANYAFIDMAYMGTTGWSNAITHIQNYSNSTTYKSVLSKVSNAGSDVIQAVGLWRNTTAINSLTITAASSTFVSGSTFTLYGIKAA